MLCYLGIVLISIQTLDCQCYLHINYSRIYTLLFEVLFCFLPQSVLSHGAVADCAVVGQEDALKGLVPLALCVLRNGESSLLFIDSCIVSLRFV